jgi:hypothetical protein
MKNVISIKKKLRQSGMKTITTITFIFFVVSTSLAQQNQYSTYFPLKAGNVWVYSWYSTQWGQSGRLRKTIDTSFTSNGHIYYRYQSYSYRVDSINANVYMYSPGNGCPWSPNEKMTDSLFARINDTVRFSCGTFYTRCVDTNYRNLFGSSRRSKHFALGYNGKVFIKDFGIYETYSGTGTAFYSEHLIGCVINGVLYGDTNLVGINTFSSEIPIGFSLSQNYPNPFNPSTKMKFSIPPSKGARGMTRLIIYDILGREVTTLVNEQLQPGIYEVEWDGTNYCSGVYFYKLITNDYSETKKMVLIK